MDRLNTALSLINSVIDWAIGEDYANYLSEYEEEHEMSIDEAIMLISDLAKKGLTK